MAGRIVNRRLLRQQAAEASQPEAAASASALAVVAPPKKAKTKVKAAATPKVRKPRAKKAPPRMRARWGIFDGGMKQVAIFDFNQRAAAEVKLADLLAKKKGGHYLQIVKEPMPEPALVEAAVVA